jgi:hypothetical protein
MSAASLSNPQSLNLYAYCGNDPVNHLDPDGLFWGKLAKFVSGFFKVLKWVIVAVAVAIAVVMIVAGPPAGLALIGATLKGLAGLGKLAMVLGFAEGGGALIVGTIAVSTAVSGLRTLGAIANYLQDKRQQPGKRRKETGGIAKPPLLETLENTIAGIAREAAKA